MVELFFLRVKLRERADELEIFRLGLQARFVFADEPPGHVLGLHHAFFLFQGNGLLFVLQNVAIRTLPALQRAVTALVHRLARRQVFQRLRQIAIAGARAQEFAQDLFPAAGISAAGGERLGKFYRQTFVLGRIFQQGFERQHARVRQVQRLGRLDNDVVRGGAVGVAVQNLFGDGERLGGIFVHRHPGLGHLRRGARATQHPFEKSAAAVAGLPELRLAQRLAAVEKARFLLQHLVEQRDGVIVVFPRQCLVALGEKHAHVARNFIAAFFCHNVCLIEPESRLTRQKSTPNAFSVSRIAPCAAARGPRAPAPSWLPPSARRAAARRDHGARGP